MFQQPPPDAEGELLPGHAGGGKVHQEGRGSGGRFLDLRRPGLFRNRKQAGLQNKESPARTGGDEALRLQLRIGALHGVDGDAELLRQLPLGGQLFTGGDVPGLDLLPQLQIELLIQRQGTVLGQQDHGTGLLSKTVDFMVSDNRRMSR